MKGISGLIEVMLIIMMLLGTKQQHQAEAASFAICFSECFLPCIIDLDKEVLVDRSKVLPCLGKCTKHCFLMDTPRVSSTLSPQQYYCNIGCAIANCTDPDALKTDLCTDNCSKNICKVSG